MRINLIIEDLKYCKMDISFWELLSKGGAFMYPLLGLSLVSLFIIMERIIFFLMRRYSFKANWNQLDLKQGNPLYRVITCYEKDLTKGETHSVNISVREVTRQICQHERGLKFLATIGAVAPLVGLLGTVWGMVKAFAQMASLGDNVTTADFADGIWTGLLTTVAGLMVAIPAVMASRMFESRVDRLNYDFSELLSHLKERHFPSSH